MLTKEKTDFKEKIKSVGPWFKWLVRRELEEYKATSAYIDMLCPTPKSKSVNDSPVKHMEKLVKAVLVQEFGEEIEKSPYYSRLVDSVMYKLQKDSLGNAVS